MRWRRPNRSHHRQRLQRDRISPWHAHEAHLPPHLFERYKERFRLLDGIA